MHNLSAVILRTFLLLQLALLTTKEMIFIIYLRKTFGALPDTYDSRQQIHYIVRTFSILFKWGEGNLRVQLMFRTYSYMGVTACIAASALLGSIGSHYLVNEALRVHSSGIFVVVAGFLVFFVIL